MTWSEFFKEVFKGRGRLGRNRHSRCVSKICPPCIIIWLAYNIMNDIPELSERLPTLMTVIEFSCVFFLFGLVICMCFLVPRRLHDFDCSGWWMCLQIVMIFSGVQFAWILTFIFWIWVGNKRGTDGKNKYGEPPPDD